MKPRVPKYMRIARPCVALLAWLIIAIGGHATETLRTLRETQAPPAPAAYEPTPTPRILILEMAPDPEVPAYTPRPSLEERMRDEERKLQIELQQARAAARSGAPRMLAPPTPQSRDEGPARPTMRELKFEDVPESVRDRILAKYGMRIVTREVRAGSSQSFLSSASTGGGDQYFAQRAPRTGVYEVFELSRRAIARMSALEEEAIRSRGFEPANAYVRRTVFGIRDSGGQPDLAVVSIDVGKP